MIPVNEKLFAFVAEARELLAVMETLLLQMESDGGGKSAIDAVFRAVHTIKGSAAIFSLESIVQLTHVTESVLDKLRSRSLILDETLRHLLLETNDTVSAQVDFLEEGKQETAEDRQRREALEKRLSMYITQTQEVMPAVSHDVRVMQPVVPSEHGKAAIGMALQDGMSSRFWHVSCRFDWTIFNYGLDPIGMIEQLSTVGRIIAVHVVDAHIPLTGFDPEQCYIGIALSLETSANEDEIAAVFEYVGEDGEIILIPPYSDRLTYAAALSLFETQENGLAILHRLHQIDAGDRKILANEKTPQKNSALAWQGKRTNSDQQLIKMHVAQLDQLIDQVGELVIASATASLVAKIKREPLMLEKTQSVADLVNKIRDIVLSFRMVKIQEVFQRMPRVIREVSRELGKEVEWQIIGEDTELDKSMIEKIANPLMHIVRNAIDHGIETPQQRLAIAKPKKGKITLQAWHESGHIVIQVHDDGGGIDQQKVRVKAIQKGLITEEAVLTQQALFELLFEPGFTTADAVTEISGRGVGMDVVKKNIEQLQGSIHVDSVVGKGTTMRIHLPLTLAIMSGFQVIVGDMVFVLPLEMVIECVDLAHYPVHHHIVRINDTALAFINLRQLFAMPLRDLPHKNLLIVEVAQQRFGLLVDELQGECQAVVKPLNKIFAKMRGLSGSAILGDGRIALVLDVPQLVDYVKQLEHASFERLTQS